MRNSEERAYRDIKNSLDTAKPKVLRKDLARGVLKVTPKVVPKALLKVLLKVVRKLLLRLPKTSCLLVHRLKVS